MNAQDMLAKLITDVAGGLVNPGLILARLRGIQQLPVGPGYTYTAQVVKRYDGDTFWVDADLGMRCWLRMQKVRLEKLDAPELENPDGSGLRSRDALNSWFDESENWVIIRTKKDEVEKWQRWLSTIYLMDKNGKQFNANQRLLDEKLAVPM